MTRHFLNELEHLKRDVLVMGGLVEAALARAVRAFLNRDPVEAQVVIEGDTEVDALELRIEEECLKILALYGPTAKDLRLVVGAFKITNDLERVGDLAQNIAERAQQSEKHERRHGADDVAEMAERVRMMLNGALDAFVTSDAEGARAVLAQDDRVDQLLRLVYDHQEEAVRADPAYFRTALRILSTAKYLERIADHATNVCEDVIYMAEGTVVKHSKSIARRTETPPPSPRS